MVPKVIPVVPFFECIPFLLEPCVRKQLVYLALREAKNVSIPRCGNIKTVQIVQASKNAFLGDAQGACEDAEFEMVIRFQSAREEATHETDHLIIKSILNSFCNRDIVFINEHYGRLVIVTGHGSCQNLKSKLKCVLV